MAKATSWTQEEREVIGTLRVSGLRPLEAADFPTNRWALDKRAAELGRKLFEDASLSRDGKTSCRTCHDPARAFSDPRIVQLPGHGARNPPSLVGVAYQSWFFWDGRKDSLWSQALSPFESPVEHGLDRKHVLARVSAKHGPELDAIFDWSGSRAGQGGLRRRPKTRDERFADVGRAIAAYEATLIPIPTAFDLLADGIASGGDPQMPPCVRAGLKAFVGKARCVSCHNGPRLENGSFHNTGVPSRRDDGEDNPSGRLRAMRWAREDTFSCRSATAGLSSEAARREHCQELDHMPVGSSRLGGAFKTPTLRGVLLSAPYMHGGQFETLEQVIAHYERAPEAPVGMSELVPLSLTPEERAGLVCLLKTL